MSKIKQPTLSERNPAVGVVSLGSDSGIFSPSSKWTPGHPIHNPFPCTTTGATAVTKPPALKYKHPSVKYQNYIQHLNRCIHKHLCTLIFLFTFQK